MASDATTTESVERALVSPQPTIDEPPIENGEQTTQTLPDEHPPEGEQPEATPQQGEETGEPQETTAAEEQEEAAIGYEDLLPSRQAKTFPDEFLALAAQRWGYDKESLDDPTHGPSLRRLLTDKINSDIYIANQRRDEAIRQQEQQAPPQEETQPAQEQQTQTQPASWEEISSLASQTAQAIITDEGANHFAPRLYDALAAIAGTREGETPNPEEQAKAYRDLTQVMTEFGILLLGQVSPQIVSGVLADKWTQEKILSPYLESVLEKREGTVDEEASTYDQARELLSKEPGYSDIAQLSGEGGALERAAEEYANETGKDIFDIQFIDPKTRQPLPPLQNAMQQLRHAITYLRGKNYQQPEALVQRALEQGRRQERTATRRSELGGSLKPGRPSGRLEPRTTSADDEMGAMQDAYDRANPLSLETSSNRTR
ncbi:MAG TPA: hypothetical protein VMW38_11800 [Terriglobia bacterium]|nr:hypothetical protein [Terriglobia bacterium]